VEPEVAHLSLVNISALLGDGGVGAFGVDEGALEMVAVGVENLSLAVLLAGRADFTLVVAAVEVGDLGLFDAHQ
jgi:hypothetical protein